MGGTAFVTAKQYSLVAFHYFPKGISCHHQLGCQQKSWLSRESHCDLMKVILTLINPLSTYIFDMKRGTPYPLHSTV